MSIDFDAYMIEYVIGDEISISTNVDGAASTINPVASPEVGFIWEEDFENLLFGSFSDVVLIFPALNKAGDIIEFDDWALEFGSFTGVAGAVNPALAGEMNEVSMFAKFWRPGDDMNEVIIGSPEEIDDYVYFEASVYSGLAPLSVVFTNYSVGSFAGFRWRRNGVVFATSFHSALTFALQGTHEITLEGYKNNGSKFYSRDIFVFPIVRLELSVSSESIVSGLGVGFELACGAVSPGGGVGLELAVGGLR